ncbi:YwaF family protein, partial [uncultured Anaerococcus sp.]|uniref:TMEM164 family acyltransferase n=1 Tax=uncultured Anaerococcus sp. TaxID=293428 RepID=UPI00280B9314
LLLVASVILQGILYFWYTLDHDLWLLEGLPLYHCRIAGICLPIVFLLKKEKSMAFFADLALVGTLVAFAVPDPSKFAWPHVTNLTYILNHYVLMACGLLVTVNRPKSLTFKEIGLASLAMNSVIFAVDLALGANYGYLTRVPIAFFDFVPVPLVFLIMTILIAIALYLVEILKKKFGTFAA